MIVQVASILKNILVAIPNGEGIDPGLIFIDKYAGLVQTVEKAQPTSIEGAFAVSKFPVSLDTNYEECLNTSCFSDLVPDSKKKGVLYFEDLGTLLPGKSRGYHDYKSKIRLVCWINNKLIQDISTCKSINHLMITKIRSNLEIGYFNSEDIKKIRITATNLIENDYKIFERYNYPSDVIKYLMFPYEAFAIDFNVEYSISESCLPELAINSTLC